MAKRSLKKPSPSKDTQLRDIAKLTLASRRGDLKTVKALLAKGVNPEASDGSAGSFSPLHYASRYGYVEIVRALLKAGADPTPFEHMLRNHTGTTTLELARSRGFIEVVALLEKAAAKKYGVANPAANAPMREALKKRDLARVLELVRQDKTLVKATDDDGNTPLHIAAEVCGLDVAPIDELLNAGANQQAYNAWGFRPVELTVWRNHLWSDYTSPRWIVTGFMVARGAPYTINLAAIGGDLAAVRRMLAAKPSLAKEYQDKSGWRPLSCAARSGQMEVVRLLLEHGADPNAKEGDAYVTYPLMAAVYANNLELVKLLLEHGASPDAYVDSGGNALYNALRRGHTAIADLLASRGASNDVSTWAWDCNLPVLSSLLKLKPELAMQALDSNDDSKPEKSALVVGLAFRYGADPKKVGYWTMYRAVDAPTLLKAFLDHGVDPNITNNEGKTLLHGMQARWRPANVESALMLLERGAKINARDDVYEATPLAWAAIWGNTDAVKLLLSKGAKTNLPDDKPWATPLFWAERKGRVEIAALLREAGAVA